MGKKELKELLLGRLHIELNLFKDSMLQNLYQEWLTRDDRGYEELKAYINDGVRVTAQPGDGKEEKYGTELSEAA